MKITLVAKNEMDRQHLDSTQISFNDPDSSRCGPLQQYNLKNDPILRDIQRPFKMFDNEYDCGTTKNQYNCFGKRKNDFYDKENSYEIYKKAKNNYKQAFNLHTSYGYQPKSP